MPQVSNNTNDINFKSLMSEPDFLNGFLKTYLPKKILKKIEVNSLEILQRPGKYLEEKTNKEFESDLVYYLKISIKNTDQDYLLLLHIEHQSSSDPLMSLRISTYQNAELLAYAQENKNRNLKPDPVIISLIYHQGRTPWKHPLNRKTFPGKVILIDLQTLSDEELLKHQGIGPIELLLKHIRLKNYKNKIQKILPSLQNYSDRIRKILLKYVAEVTDFSKSEFLNLIERCAPKDEGVVMTLAERWIEEGKLEGKLEGRLESLKEVVRRMLFAGLGENLIQTATGLSMRDIEKIRKELSH